MRRVGRRLDVEALRGGLPLRAFFFDCLRIGEQSIADRTTSERYQALAGAVPAEALMPRLVTSAESAARDFYDAALAAGHEGLGEPRLGLEQRHLRRPLVRDDRRQ